MRPSHVSRKRLWTAAVALAAVILGVERGVGRVDARSTLPPPIERIHHPREVSLTVIPRTPGSNPEGRGLRKRNSYPEDELLSSDALMLNLMVEIPDRGGRDGGMLERVNLHLTPSEYLFHPQAKITIKHPDGRTSVEPLNPADYRLYHGDVILDPVHSARRLAEERVAGLWYPPFSELERGVRGRTSITVHEHGQEGTVFEGMFEIDGEVYHVLTKEGYERHRSEAEPLVVGQGERMVIFREGDRVANFQRSDNHAGCSHDHLAFNNNATHPIRTPLIDDYSPPRPLSWLPTSASKWDLPFLSHPSDPFASLRKRDDISGNVGGSNFIGSIGNTAGCPTEQRIVYMGVAADCNYVARYTTAQAAKTQILTNWNSISALYHSTFNISIGIIDLNVADPSCPSGTPSDEPWNTACDSTTTLNDRLRTFSQWRGTQSAAAGLWHLMSGCPTDAEVGVAWLGTLCQTDASGSAGSYVSSTGVSTAAQVEWSLISHEIGHNFGAIHDCSSSCTTAGSCCPLTTSTCNANGQYIMNPTTSTSEVAFSPCTIGNICSGMQTRTLTTSCLVSPGGQKVLSLQSCGNGIVEDGEDCDPGQNVTSPCCNSSRSCPEDKTQPEGKSCGSNGLACASGQCTSLNLQCQTVGATLNLTTACGAKGDQSCTVNCQNPAKANQCVVLQSPLIDGSPCGYGGHCQNATCNAGSLSDTINSWYTQNLQYSIPATILGSLFVLSILVTLLRRLFCGGCWGRKGKSAKTQAVAPEMLHRANARNRNGPMMQPSGYGPSFQGRPGYPGPPPNVPTQPPPTYNNTAGHQMHSQPWLPPPRHPNIRP